MAVEKKYSWIVYCSCIAAFVVCYGIGGNDLANSFGTAYGAKVLTLKQVIIVASFMELGGAVLLGGEVAKTISSKVTKSKSFAGNPYEFMYGMFSALVATAIWLIVATMAGLPVSTTHSIIGAVVGFAVASLGGNGVLWSASAPDFPYFEGVIPVSIAWLTTPALAMLLAMLVYFILRLALLRPLTRAAAAGETDASGIRPRIVVAFIIFFTIWLNLYFILTKGMKNRVKISEGMGVGISFGVGGFFGIIGFFLAPILMRRKRDVQNEEASPEVVAEEAEKKEEEGEKAEGEETAVVDEQEARRERIEKFSDDAEQVFWYLQILSSCVVSFAHGANDVSNGIGALAAVLAVNSTGKVPKEASVPIWMLFLGGIGIVVGLATFGTRILAVLGEELVVLTPSRGFSAEYSAALIISVASAVGFPVSTTHCITGSVIGIGLLEGASHVAWCVVLRTAFGWIFTLIVAGILGGLIFAQGVFAPCK